MAPDPGDHRPRFRSLGRPFTQLCLIAAVGTLLWVMLNVLDPSPGVESVDYQTGTSAERALMIDAFTVTDPDLRAAAGNVDTRQDVELDAVAATHMVCRLAGIYEISYETPTLTGFAIVAGAWLEVAGTTADFGDPTLTGLFIDAAIRYGCAAVDDEWGD